MIVTSSIVSNRAQPDGRSKVRERHTDDAGAEHVVDYMAKAGADAGPIMAARVPGLEAALADEVAARKTADSRKALAEAEDAYFAKMTDEQIKTTLELPVGFEVPKDG